jgi:nicotinamide-nucleotide amidase
LKVVDKHYNDGMDEKLAVLVGVWLRKRDLKLVTAESCTGGLIGDLITNIPGSSEYYLGGAISYAYEAKTALLGVPPGLLAMFGAVSRETVLEMAHGARETLAKEHPLDGLIGLAVSGIAGPSGGTLEKPIGLTWIGLSAPGLQRAWQFVWNGDRIANKQSSAREALQLLLEYLQGNPRAGT